MARDTLLQLFEQRLDDMSAPPTDLEAAIKLVNQLREQRTEAGRIASAQAAQISKLQGQLKELLRVQEALQEVLGAFSERGDGWFQGAVVPREDYNSWCKDAGL